MGVTCKRDNFQSQSAQEEFKAFDTPKIYSDQRTIQDHIRVEEFSGDRTMQDVKQEDCSDFHKAVGSEEDCYLRSVRRVESPLFSHNTSLVSHTGNRDVDRSADWNQSLTPPPPPIISRPESSQGTLHQDRQTSLLTHFRDQLPGVGQAEAQLVTWQRAGHNQASLVREVYRQRPATKAALRLLLVKMLSSLSGVDIPAVVSVATLLDTTVSFFSLLQEHAPLLMFLETRLEEIMSLPSTLAKKLTRQLGEVFSSMRLDMFHLGQVWGKEGEREILRGYLARELGGHNLPRELDKYQVVNIICQYLERQQ